jgi:hypothetical protein
MECQHVVRILAMFGKSFSDGGTMLVAPRRCVF